MQHVCTPGGALALGSEAAETCAHGIPAVAKTGQQECELASG